MANTEIIAPEIDAHSLTFRLPVHVFRPANSIVEGLQTALAQLTRFLPLSRPHWFAYLCRTASRRLHSQPAPFVAIAADLKGYFSIFPLVDTEKKAPFLA